MTLGSGSAGVGITSDNVTPMNLIYVRKVGYGVRTAEEITKLDLPEEVSETTVSEQQSIDKLDLQLLQRILKEVVERL
jgi:hypothetical protein